MGKFGRELIESMKQAVAHAEKYFAERAVRADVPKALAILERAGVGNPPVKATNCAAARSGRSGPVSSLLRRCPDHFGRNASV
jgi:hypothetical protein